MRSMFPQTPTPWPTRKYDLVFLGTMSATSGTFVILEAIKQLTARFPSLKCLFIGLPGEEIRAKAFEFVEQNNLTDNVVFTGRLPYSEIPNLLADCKIGLIGLVDLPKFHKNIATKMFEYMACGIPVVSSDLPPERKYIIPGKCGYLIPPEDSTAMAEAIAKILSDSELGNEMSAFCCQHMAEKKYYAENEIEKLAEFYACLLNYPRELLCTN